MVTAEPEPFKTQELYGGALLLSMPERFADVSDARPVPDHQEVWADPDEDQSLVVEVVEWAGDVGNEEVGRFYFQDLAAVNESVASQLEGTRLLNPDEVPNIASNEYAAAVLAHGSQRVSKGREAPSAANDVDVQLVILRLPAHGSDLLLSLNTPRSISRASSAAQHAGSGQKMRHVDAADTMLRMLASLTIRDWSLFG